VGSVRGRASPEMREAGAEALGDPLGKLGIRTKAGLFNLCCHYGEKSGQNEALASARATDVMAWLAWLAVNQALPRIYR
jgi:hypothetical protein